MKKKTLVRIAIAVVILVILYLLWPFLGENFFGEPVKGVVHNPSLPGSCCDADTVIEIKCYRFVDFLHRKHYALNDKLFCLSGGQKVRIDHDYRDTVGKYEITARVVAVREENDCPKQ
jgi:hypothetical protein